MSGPGWVYILKCSDDSYYTGSTDNLIKRMNQHINGVFKGYTSSRLPIDLVYSKRFESMKEAYRAEMQIKGWSRKKKEALIDGNFDQLHELAKCINITNFENTEKQDK